VTDATPFDLDELESAVRYQQWMIAAVQPYLGERVLEIGAGSGNMSRWLRPRERLILTEPDPALAARLEDAPAAHEAPPADGIAVERFDPVADDPGRFAAERIDTIVSFNVLEHIERDDVALRTLAAILEAGGSTHPRRIVAVVPAHGFAFGTLDTTFEHHRRYDHAGFAHVAEAAVPGGRVVTRSFNPLGLPGWILAGRVLRQRRISPGQIRLSEALVPVYRWADQTVVGRFGLRYGQSLIGVIELPSRG
jgi:SAM-dependent methyltransferase